MVVMYEGDNRLHQRLFADNGVQVAEAMDDYICFSGCCVPESEAKELVRRIQAWIETRSLEVKSDA